MTDVVDPEGLAERLRTYLLADIEECKRLNYNPTAFRVMLDQYGAVGAVKKLLEPPVSRTSDGFRRLWELGRLDLAAEYPVAFVPDFAPLFTDEEREIARARVAAHGRPTA